MLLRFLAFVAIACAGACAREVPSTDGNDLQTSPLPLNSEDIRQNRMVYLINLLAIPRDTQEGRARKSDTNDIEESSEEKSKQFPTLLLLQPVAVQDESELPDGVYFSPDEEDRSASPTQEQAEPIYVKKLDELPKNEKSKTDGPSAKVEEPKQPTLNRQRRHLKKLLFGGGGGGYGGGFGGGFGGGYSGGYGGGYEGGHGGGYGGGHHGGGGYGGVEKTVIVTKYVPVYESQHGGGGYGGGYGGGGGGGYGGGYGGGGGGGGGGGYGGGYGGGNSGGYGGSPHGGGGYQSGGGGGGSSSFATASASATASSSSGGYGYRKR